MYRIGILGAGTFGMALSRLLSRNGHAVTVWSHHAGHLAELAQTRTHPKLPDMVIPPEVDFTPELSQVCRDKDVLLFAVPSVYVRQVAHDASPYIPAGQIIVDVAKGIEPGTLLTMCGVLRDELDRPDRTIRTVALSGPTHAEEVALDLPTTIVSAGEDAEAAALVQDLCMNTCMRVYTNTDALGVELSGAMKNVMALAAGIAAGVGGGDNIRAAIITRGMAEITRLGIAMGCRLETFYGLAGIGDLIVTAMSRHSRNNRAGYLIGQGRSAAEAAAEVGMVVEGLNALPAATELSRTYHVELPIAETVNAIVCGQVSPAEGVRVLMERDRKPERIS